METRALQTAVEWMKLCPVCRRETIHRADQDCDLGLIAHCTRCGREILSTSPIILRVARGARPKGPVFVRITGPQRSAFPVIQQFSCTNRLIASGHRPLLPLNPMSPRGPIPMAEKVKKLNLDRDYKKYLYFIDGGGNVCQKPKSGEGSSKVLVQNAIERENGYLYFIDKEGDVARSPRGTRKQKAA